MDYGLALSGGGPRGAAHAGVIAALEENRLLPSSVSGASAGSVAAALLACGYSARDMARTVEFISEKGNKVIDPDILGMLLETPHRLIGSDVRLSGILKGNRMEKFFKKLVGD